MTRNCERCGMAPPRIASGIWAGQSHMHKFCVHCSKDLCEKCLVDGKCRENPAGKHEIEPEDP